MQSKGTINQVCGEVSGISGVRGVHGALALHDGWDVTASSNVHVPQSKATN